MTVGVEAFYAAVNAGDLERLQRLIAPDAVFHVAGDSSISGDHRGQEEIFALAARVLSETDGSFRTELLESISNGPYSAARVAGRGAPAGRPVPRPLPGHARLRLVGRPARGL